MEPDVAEHILREHEERFFSTAVLRILVILVRESFKPARDRNSMVQHSPASNLLVPFIHIGSIIFATLGTQI